MNEYERLDDAGRQKWVDKIKSLEAARDEIIDIFVPRKEIVMETAREYLGRKENEETRRAIEKQMVLLALRSGKTEEEIAEEIMKMRDVQAEAWLGIWKSAASGKYITPGK